MHNHQRGLVWFRQDLRLHDNIALHQAALYSKNALISVFFITESLWKKRHIGNAQQDFILRNLHSLSLDLSKKNIPLLIRVAEDEKEISEQLLAIAAQYQLEALYFNRCYESDQSAVDQKITRLFQRHQKSVFSFDDQVIFPPGSVLNQSGNFYKVFTPFKKRWFALLEEQGIIPVFNRPRKYKTMLCCADPLPNIKESRSSLAALWPAGEKGAQRELKDFTQQAITQYDQQRDFPFQEATSRLSPYLSIGVISPRLCLQMAATLKRDAGVQTWIAELIWREFYKHLLFAYPRLYKGEPFQPSMQDLNWENNRKLFNAWKQGRTGYPLVDAAMRQLNTTGWMHNRLRMIVAMFLSKLLWIDWRWGEHYFAEHLIDYDFSANNGGWQWCASTGADAVPYFRIFNPTLQSKRFDPNGDFIRQYCPELKNLNAREIHMPPRGTYIKPIIDYRLAKEAALQAYKANRSRRKSDGK